MNDSNCEVWGNLGICFIQLKNLNKLLNALKKVFLEVEKIGKF